MDEPERDLDPLRRAAGLRDELEALARRTADVAEFSARVHEDLAVAHELLPNPQLAPDDLRRHAEHSRAFAAEERRRAQALLSPRGSSRPASPPPR